MKVFNESIPNTFQPKMFDWMADLEQKAESLKLEHIKYITTIECDIENEAGYNEEELYEIEFYCDQMPNSSKAILIKAAVLLMQLDIQGA